MIKEFQGEYRWLSNFTKVNITIDGVTFPSIEHAYVSMKIEDNPDWIKFCSNPNVTSGQIKRACRDKQIREDWEEIKLEVMELLCRIKFNKEPFKTYLLSTGDKEIQEGNKWNDTFWGICLKTGIGENHLGKIIMKIRKELKQNI